MDSNIFKTVKQNTLHILKLLKLIFSPIIDKVVGWIDQVQQTINIASGR